MYGSGIISPLDLINNETYNFCIPQTDGPIDLDFSSSDEDRIAPPSNLNNVKTKIAAFELNSSIRTIDRSH